MPFEISYSQLLGGYHRQQQDALFNGLSVCQMKRKIPSSYCHLGASTIVAVADGIAAHPQSQLASRFWMEQLALANQQQEEINAKWIRQHFNLFCQQYSQAGNHGVATTLALTYIKDNHCHIYSIGDSRIYLIRHNDCTQLTEDHSLIQRMIREGTADKNTDYADAYNLLEYCLIADEDEYDFPIFVTHILLEDQDQLLLCTDGLHEIVGDDFMNTLESKNLENIAGLRFLEAEVKRKRVTDDCSLVLLKYLNK